MDMRAWHGQPWRLVTSTLPHIDVIHLAFNLYWLWVFGTRLEDTLGRWALAGLMLFFAVGASAAEYALFQGGVGLSGVGYGLFGLLWVLSRKDPRFAGAVDGQTVALFLGWFILCCVLTATGAWKVGNVAHAAGAMLGVLVGIALSVRGRLRVAVVGLLSGTIALIFLGATALRPQVNLAGQMGAEWAYLGYRDLEEERNQSAADKYRQAVGLDPNQANWWYGLAVAQERLDQTSEAVASLQRAQSLRPDDSSWRQFLVPCKVKLAYQEQLAGHHEVAIQLYREILDVDDHQASCWFNLGAAYHALGRTEAARKAYRRAVALEPANNRYRAALQSLPE
jgi:GlpG protein